MIVLGIDPGFGRCGYAVLLSENGVTRILGFGTIVTAAQTPFAERLEEIAEDFSSLLARYKPDLVCIEDLFFVKNVSTGLRVAEVRGVLSYLAQKQKLPVRHPKPVEIKKTFTGNGAATKKEILKMCMLTFQLEKNPKLDDAADALAVAFWGTVAPPEYSF